MERLILYIMAQLQFEPGFYSKVRIDDEGNIVDVSQIESQDLPSHKHSVADIKEGLTNEIFDVISQLFANSESTAVQFTYDPKTKKVFADVNIDDESIQKNEYGQLISAGSTDSGISQSDLSSIEKKISKVKDDIQKEVETQLAHLLLDDPDSGIKFVWDEKLKVYRAKILIDGLTVTQNEFGELSAAGEGGVSTECGNHTHTTSQITDFQQAVINIFNNFSKNLNFDISNYIDGTTIKINDQGQITAVRTAMEKHKHTLEDIVDYKSPDPAALQPMKDLGEDVDYKAGVIDFSKLNIGFSILVLSEYLKNNVNKKIDELATKIAELNLSKDSNSVNLLSIAPESLSNILYDTDTKFYREVFYSKNLDLEFDFLPILQGDIILLKSGSEIARTTVEKLGRGKDGPFSVYKVYEKKSFPAKILRINISDYIDKEGFYTFQLKFGEETYDFSNDVRLFATPNFELEYEWKDLTSTHKIGNHTFYNKNAKRIFSVEIKNFENYRFVNNSGIFENGKYIGIAPGDFNFKVRNLFTETNIPIKFEFEEESSDCEFLNYLKVQGCEIINNIAYLNGNECIFEIPGTSFYNSLEIIGIPLEICSIIKGNLTASGKEIAEWPRKSGVVQLDTSEFGVLSFLNNYSNNKTNIQLKIQGEDPVDLTKIKVFGREI